MRLPAFYNCLSARYRTMHLVFKCYQIARFVGCLNATNVMNVFVRLKPAPVALFPYSAMLKDVAVLIRRVMVWLENHPVAARVLDATALPSMGPFSARIVSMNESHRCSSVLAESKLRLFMKRRFYTAPTFTEAARHDNIQRRFQHRSTHAADHSTYQSCHAWTLNER